MPTHTNTQMDKPSGRPARLLLGLTAALFALLILNLAVFDDLRTDPSAGELETFTKPQHLSSLVVVLIAAALVAFRHRSAARVAIAVATIEIVAFTFFHAIPVEVGPSKPYWGDGMGDPLQWVGFLSILAVSAAIVGVARRSPNVAVTPAAVAGPRERRRLGSQPAQAGHRTAPGACSRHRCENSVINLEPALRPEGLGFSLALRSGAVTAGETASSADEASADSTAERSSGLWFRWRARCSALRALSSGQRYDLTVTLPGTVGVEFVKTLPALPPARRPASRIPRALRGSPRTPARPASHASTASRPACARRPWRLGAGLRVRGADPHPARLRPCHSEHRRHPAGRRRSRPAPLRSQLRQLRQRRGTASCFWRRRSRTRAAARARSRVRPGPSARSRAAPIRARAHRRPAGVRAAPFRARPHSHSFDTPSHQDLLEVWRTT